MVDATLVKFEPEEGLELAKALEGAGVPIAAAYWLYNSTLDEWKFFVVTPEASAGSRNLYVKAHSAGVALPLSDVQFVTEDDETYLALRGGEPAGTGWSHTRMERTLMPNRFIEAAVIYRI